MSDIQIELRMDVEKQIVHVIVHGTISKKAGEKIITQARTKAAENRYSILCDVRKAIVKANLGDWFYLPRTLNVYTSTQAVKTAILITPGVQETDYRLFETVSHNVGLNIRVFFNEKDAIEWLGDVDVEEID